MVGQLPSIRCGAPGGLATDCRGAQKRRADSLANCLPANALGCRGRAEASGLGTDTPAGNGRPATGRVNAGRQGLWVERAARRQRLRIERARVILRHRLRPSERRHRRSCQHGGTGNGRRRRTKDSWHDESSSSHDRGTRSGIPAARHRTSGRDRGNPKIKQPSARPSRRCLGPRKRVTLHSTIRSPDCRLPP